MATQSFSSIQNFTANITAYNGATKVATLDSPVNISLGVNGGQDINSTYSIRGLQANVSKAISAGKPLQLSTDESGNFVGIFNVPPGTFQTGSRVFRIDNRRVLSDPTTATTYAEATFTASGLATKSQQLDFAPSVDSSSQSFTQVSQQAQTSVIVTKSPYDPIAQSFLVDVKNYPNGLFLNSVKLFFQSVPSGNSPVTVSIVPTVNGYPSGSALSYSTVTLQANQCQVSQSPHYLDPTTYTEFMFQAPVYILPGTLYAILIKSNSPDYYLYYAKQNQIALPSTAKAKPSDANPSNPTKVGTAPYIGALFESQNSITWTADQTSDLMFVIDQCVFATSAPAQVPFVVPSGLPYRKLAHQDLRHKLDANTVLNAGNVFSGDRTYHALNLSRTDFSPTSTEILYSYQTTLASGNVQTVAQAVNPAELGTAMPDNILLNDGNGERILLGSSNNSFTMFATMQSSDPNVSPIISDDGVTLYTVKNIINNMPISNSMITLVNTGSGYNVNTASVTITSPDVGSNAASLGLTANNGLITSVYVISGGSGYLTNPTITIYDPTTRSGNANAIISVNGETSSTGGNSFAKYFTKKVVMAPGNDSGDLRVFLDAYQPIGTGIYVYYKILSSQDPSPFDLGSWQLMTCVNNFSAYSTNTDNIIEYEYAPGVLLSNQANNNISYVSVNGQTYTSFIQFAIKVVLTTSDPTIIPSVNSLTAIALPPGTGL